MVGLAAAVHKYVMLSLETRLANLTVPFRSMLLLGIAQIDALLEEATSLETEREDVEADLAAAKQHQLPPTLPPRPSLLLSPTTLCQL